MTFTDKEKLVMDHLMRGATDQQIAKRTGLDVHAVRVATAAILRKTGLRNRTLVALWALRQSMNGYAVH